MAALMLTLYGIPNCDTIKKSRGWLAEHGVVYEFHDYKKAGIDAATLDRWADQAGWEALLNRAGTTFRKLADADKADLDRARGLALMIAQPSLIKRPIAEAPDILLIGFKPDVWSATFG